MSKSAPFETLDELRLVYGADLDILYGEDVNLNGVLDPNENDGPLSPPNDNRDGRLDAGIFEYLTVYSRQPNRRTNINTTRELEDLLQQKFGPARAKLFLRQRGVTTGNRSVLEFYLKTQMTADEFAQIASTITVTNSAYIEGLINVNTASAEVLACVPGIGTDKAQSVVAYRQSNPDKLTSVAWVAQALDQSSAIQAGPYLTVESYQFTPDIPPLGPPRPGFNPPSFFLSVSQHPPQ